MTGIRLCLLVSIVLGSATIANPSAAQKKYDPGATDTKIKIGNIMPYSGPGSPYSMIGKTEAAYFKKINAEGGINGRMIEFVSYDDAYSPPKTLEQTRRLVESDQVLFLFQILGTAHNTAIQSYLNEKKIPQLLIAAGATKWNDPEHFPWTMPLVPSYQTEAQIYANYLLANHPNGKIGILYQNDDYGKDYVKGLKEGLGGRMKVVADLSYESAEPTIYSELANLQASGADIFFDVTSAKFAAQTIKRTAEIGWKPLHILNSVSASIGSVFTPAGLENSAGILSAIYLKDATDPIWKDDAGFQEWSGFMDKYMAGIDKSNGFTIYGYVAAQTLIQILKQCGDDLSRENVMRQAASLDRLALGMLLPGITISTSPTDYAPLKQLQMVRFDGQHLVAFGPVVSGGMSRN
jgi:branched-chain amino acid transport system substrate-binding protein